MVSLSCLRRSVFRRSITLRGLSTPSSHMKSMMLLIMLSVSTGLLPSGPVSSYPNLPLLITPFRSSGGFRTTHTV